MREMVGSEGTVSWKMASASRWRSGDDGAVNSKTAGAVKATLSNRNPEWATSLGDYRQGHSRNPMRNNRPVGNVPRMLVPGALLVQARNLEGGDEYFGAIRIEIDITG